MVTRITACLAILGAACLCQCRSEAPARLCFASRDAFGRNQSTLQCGRDSCYFMQFSGNAPLERAVGLFGAPVHPDTLAKGDSLVLALMKLEISPRQQVSGSFSVRRNDSALSIPRTLRSDSPLVILRKWVHNRRRETEKALMWTDSLKLSRSDKVPGEITIRFASGAEETTLLGRPLRLGIYHTFYTDAVREEVPSQVLWLSDSLQPLFSRSGLKYQVPKGVAAVRANLKIVSRKGSPPLPDACLEGLFELESGHLRVAGLNSETQ